MENLHFKNGIDTVLVEGIIIEMGKKTDQEILQNLEKEGKLKVKDFGYALSFKPASCSKSFYISSRDTSELVKKLFNEKFAGTKVLLTCIFFEKYKLYDSPFFIIDKVQME
jgi:predicted Zn-ribbon and HTH transcriptional regulator